MAQPTKVEWKEKIDKWYLEHQDHVDKLLDAPGYSFAPSAEDTNHPELWKPGSWKWYFALGEKDSKMCHYSNVYGMSRSHQEENWCGTNPDMWNEKSKRVRCPACGRSMMSNIRVCHDGCCIYHCIPPHKKKEWWKKGKKQSRDNKMRRR